MKFDKQKERDSSDWAQTKITNGQIYEQVDLDKFKYKKSYIAKIKSDQPNNTNHHRLKSRYY